MSSPSCGKSLYRTKSDAKRAIKQVNSTESGFKKLKCVYRCLVCIFYDTGKRPWHITSNAKRRDSNE